MTAVAKFARAPFPYFGGKSMVADDVWLRLGRPRQYIEPFCGSAAMLLAAPTVASLEVINDANFYIANFWRALKNQPEKCAEWADYPVSHVDLDARHAWLTQPARTAELRALLADADWPGDPKIAGWWVWGQCCWIGSGWCEKEHRTSATQAGACSSKIPHVSDAGRGVQSKIPHVGNAGMGVQSKIPHVGNAGMGQWFAALARRLQRVRVVHGSWDRCLNHHYGATETAVFLDPPYRAYEGLYAKEGQAPVADAVCDWARDNAGIRIALCGHMGDYDLPGWEVMQWDRGRLTYGGGATTAEEAIWFSPACQRGGRQGRLL